ncbi:MAG: hypothetical protein Q8L55_05025 [Phycisphaerales bacterium]|nr:hypothetical protein [Phycisphaerales bacterium]
MLTLAQSDTTRLITLVLLVIGAIFVATVAILIVRKRVLSQQTPPAAGMIMDDFRKLHASGKLSDSEFQALRTRMAARMKSTVPGKGSVHEEPPAAPRTAPPPRVKGPPRQRPPRPE